MLSWSGCNCTGKTSSARSGGWPITYVVRGVNTCSAGSGRTSTGALFRAVNIESKQLVALQSLLLLCGKGVLVEAPVQKDTRYRNRVGIWLPTFCLRWRSRKCVPRKVSRLRGCCWDQLLR